MTEKYICDGDEGSECIGAKIASDLSEEHDEFFKLKREQLEAHPQYGELGIFAGYGEYDDVTTK